jgi:hypothetical protein
LQHAAGSTTTNRVMSSCNQSSKKLAEPPSLPSLEVVGRLPQA